MKTVKYEPTPGALLAFLAAKPQLVFFADLYTINLAGGVNGGDPLLWTTADSAITIPYGSGSVTYACDEVLVDQLNQKAVGHWKVGLDVDTWQVLTTPNGLAATIGDEPYLSAVRAGALDGAEILVDRVFFNPLPSGLPVRPTNPLGSSTLKGVVNIFTGRVANVDFGRSNAPITALSHLQLLDINMPHNLFQAGCRWTLFSSRCGISRDDFVVHGSLNGNGSTNFIPWNTSVPGGSGTYALGYIVMTSGANEGFSRMIRSWTPGSPGSFTLLSPFPYPVLSGDTFDAYPGCDKQKPTCGRFNNMPHYGGMPDIPAPEAAV